MAPSVTAAPIVTLSEIRRRFGLWTRKFYELFPNGLGEAYRLADVPEEAIAERLRTTEKPRRLRKARS